MLAGRFGRAARLFAAAQRLRDTSDAPPAVYVLYYDQAVVDRHVAALRTALGEAAFGAAWAAGQALTREQAIAEALDEGAVSGPDESPPRTARAREETARDDGIA